MIQPIPNFTYCTALNILRSV